MSQAGVLNFQNSVPAAIETITGNTGGAQSPDASHNFNIKTANSTPQFVGTANTETLDFGLSNLILGNDGQTITFGTKNVGLGLEVFDDLTVGSGNTSVGYQSSINLVSGSNNVVVGSQAFITSTISNQNVAIGVSSLGYLTTSTGSNTAIGYASLFSLETGTENVAIGESAGSEYTSSESSNVVISNTGALLDNNTIRIGTKGSSAGEQNKCFIAGIAGVTTINRQIVTIESVTGQLGSSLTIPSAVQSNITQLGIISTVLRTSSGRVVNVTTPGAYPYTTLASDDLILADSSSAHTIIPLTSPATGQRYTITDATGSAAANNITITPSGNNINGAASFVMNSNYQSITITYSGTQWLIS